MTVLDTIATVVLSLALLAAAGAALFMSPFLVMATDSAGDKPRTGMLGWAFVVTWGGVAAGVIGAAVGVLRSVRSDTTMWWWPALGIAVVGASFALGGLLATRVVRKAD